MKFAMKPCFSSYIFFSILGLMGGGALNFPFIVITSIMGNPLSDTYVWIILCIGFVFTIVYLSRYRIIVEDDNVVIPESLFNHKKSTVLISELVDVKLQIGVGDKKKKSFYTLWLKTGNGKSQINIKTFSIPDLEHFMNYIYETNNDIKFDRYSQSMIEGRFKDVISAGISTFMKYVLILSSIAIVVVIMLLMLI